MHNTIIKDVTPESDLSEEHLVVKKGSGKKEVTPTTGTTDQHLGVATEEMNAGQLVPVQTDGKTSVRCDGSVTRYDEVTLSGSKNGYIQAKSNGSAGDTIVGMALHDASDGDLLRIQLYDDKTETKA